MVTGPYAPEDGWMERELHRASREMGACPKCSGRRFEARGSSQMRLWRSSGRFAAFHQSEMDGVVCERCGFTELYARDPEKLRPEDGG